ncbi:MAG: hypothetical protein ACLFUL_00115 [Desulfobacteraceae bacterium]
MRPGAFFFPFMVVLSLVCLMGTGFAQTGSAKSEQPDPGPLALHKVVLFKSGVGYFELKGRVSAGKQVTLYFKHGDMSDILKSLTVLNLGQGRIAGVVYENKKTTAQQLEDFGFDLSSQKGLPGILEQFQGSAIEIAAGNLAITGRIAGVEKRLILEEKVRQPRFLLSIMTPTNTLRTFRMDEVTSFRFLNPQLNEDLGRYLAIKCQSRLKRQKSVTIIPSGTGPQDLLVSYVTQAPVWKATYRIVLPQEEDHQPFIQGWAIVDNVTDTDWESVHLSLISGLPISFVQNLYDPRFKERPVLETEEALAVKPTIPETGMGKESEKAAAPMARSGRRDLALMGADKKAEINRLQQVEQGLRSMMSEAVTRSVGDLFEYKISRPVTIARNHSALVAIVSKDIDGQAVDLYNAATRAQNPLAAVRLKNTTDLTLEGGPLTVISGDCYAGEAFIRTLKPNEHRYITYAVDLGLHVNTKQGTKTEAVDRVIINQGLIRMHRGILETTAYHLHNHNDRTKTVVIEHPHHPDWKLLNKTDPIEITENYLRFEVEAPPHKNTLFTIKEMRDSWESVMVKNVTPDDMLLFIRKGYLEDTAETKLKQLVRLKAEISNLNQALESLKQERQQIFDDQKRLRENLESLGPSMEEKALKSRYIQQLNQQENRLDTLAQKEKELIEARNAKQARLEEDIRTLGQDLRL